MTFPKKTLVLGRNPLFLASLVLSLLVGGVAQFAVTLESPYPKLNVYRGVRCPGLERKP